MIRFLKYTLLGFVLLVVLFVAVAVIQSEYERSICNPYDIYDDAFTGEVYQSAHGVDAKDIESIEFLLYSYRAGPVVPCDVLYDDIMLLERTSDGRKIGVILEALHEKNACNIESGMISRFKKRIGIRITAKDGRKTFFTVYLYPCDVTISAFPQKKYKYNLSSYDSTLLHSRLKEEGILDAIPGFTAYAAGATCP